MNRLYSPPAPMDPYRADAGDAGTPSPAPRPFPSGQPEQALFRVDLNRALQLHRRLAMGVALAGVALAVIYFLKLWPTYVAESTVYVQPASPKVMDMGGASRWPYDEGTYESYIQQQMISVTHDDVLAVALQKLGPGTWQGSNESDQAAIERLKHSINVSRVGSYQFSIAGHASNPDEAAQLANAVTAGYIESSTRAQKVGDSQRLTALRAERDRIQSSLTADRTEQAALNKQLGVASIGNTTPDHYDEDITQTRTQLVKARTDHDEAAAKFAAMNASRGGASTAIDAQADEIASADAGLASMKTSLNARRATLISQMANLTPNHPQYRQDAEELAKINTTIDSMTRDLRAKAAARIQEQLRTNLEQTAGVEAQLNGQLRQLVGAAGDATTKMQRASDLASDITRLQARYNTVDELLHNLMLEDAAPGSAFLTSAAVPPLHPAKSGVVRNTIVLAFGGLMLGLLAAIVAHKLDPRVYIASDVENVLGFVPMAQLPDFLEVSDEVAEEHLLRLATAIEYSRKQGDLRSCIFTGTGPGTGVTTVATRVREMLEAMGRTTVLVDALGTPSSAAGSGAQNGHSGAQNLLAAERGSRSSALLQKVAEETKAQEESLVITDTAPLLLSAETAYLARFVDCVIVVIESGVTTRDQLRDVATALQRLNVAAVGFVLNRVGLAKADPGFRHSVQAVERHLQSQSRSTSRKTVRSSASAAEPAPAANSYPQEAAARVEPQPAAPVAASAVAVSPVIRPTPAPAEPFRPSVAAGPQPPPQRVARPAPAAEPQQPLPAAAPHMPWWLADAQPQPSLPLPVPVPQPVRVREPEVASFQPVPPVAPRLATQPEVPPAQSWERVSSRRDTHEPAVPAERARPWDYEETPPGAASRLSGLRNLLFSLGLKNLNSTRESSGYEDEPLPQSQPDPEYAGYTRVYTAPPAPSAPTPVPVAPPRSSQVDTAPRLVTAAPEFLPPRPAAQTTGKYQTGDPDATSRRDRRDNYDEVEILPSWRGQYRKKN